MIYCTMESQDEIPYSKTKTHLIYMYISFKKSHTYGIGAVKLNAFSGITEEQITHLHVRINN